MSIRQEPLFHVEQKARRKPTGPHADCIRFWELEWLKTRGFEWKWTAQHATNVARALRLAGSVAEFEVRARNLLATGDQWLKKAASPSVLVSHWNEPVLAKRPPRPRPPQIPSTPPAPQKPSAILPEGWGARMAEALRSRDGVESVLRELQPPTSSGAPATGTRSCSPAAARPAEHRSRETTPGAPRT